MTNTKITQENIADSAITTSKIADNAVTPTQLNVNGNGTLGQFLTSAGNGSFNWTAALSGVLSSNGWTTLPNGLMIQWGSFVSNTDPDQTVNFTTPFPTACYCVLTDVQLRSSSTSFNTTSFTINRDDVIDGSQTRYFIAIGK